MSNDAPATGLEPWLLTYVAEQAQPVQVDPWVDRVTGAILTAMPDMRSFDGVEALLRTTVRDHWVAFLADFAQPDQHFHLVDAAVHLAEVVADLHIGLEQLIQFYRVAQQEVWAYVSEVIKALPQGDFDRADLLLYFWSRAGVWLDKSIGASVTIYQAARAKVLAGAAAQRYESVKAILAGEVVDIREASAALGGYPISVHHTAFVLSVDDPGRAGSLEPVANDLVRALGGTNPLLVKPGGRQLWVWVGTRDVPDVAALVSRTATTAPGSVCVGVGSPTTGIEGFIASHAEAQGALRVARPDDAASWLRSYADVELPVILGCSPEVDRFMARQLGPLSAGDEPMARIRETITAFLDHGGNAEEASRQLLVHRNTIRYRIGQAEEMLGHPITKVSAELSVALRHHELFHT